MSKKPTNDKPKKWGKTAIDRAEDVAIQAESLYEFTNVPVTVSIPDWALLKRLGKLTMRVPHDEKVAYLGSTPVRIAS